MTGPLPKNPVFCAIDTPDLAQALRLAQAVKDHVGGLKVGLEFFNHQGPDGVRQIVETGLPVFTDLKFHDIPNTVAGAVRGIAPLGPALLNVHAAGGLAMMRAAKEAALEAAGDKAPLVIGVTLLTSLNETDLERQGIAGSSEDHVRRLAAQPHVVDADLVAILHASSRPPLSADHRVVPPALGPRDREAVVENAAGPKRSAARVGDDRQRRDGEAPGLGRHPRPAEGPRQRRQRA